MPCQGNHRRLCQGKSSSTVICANSAGAMVAVRMRSCNATDEDLPSACMRTGMLPTSVAWIELSSRRMMSVGKMGILQGTHMFWGASESIIQSSERPSELDAICAMRAMLFLSDNLIGKVENGGTEPIPQTQHTQVLRVAHQRSSHRQHQKGVCGMRCVR